MTPEERDIIARFIGRVGGAEAGGFGSGGQAPALPPIDPEADRFIGEQFASHPEARYRITQLAFVQEAALVEAQNRIKRLESDLAQARTQAPPAGQSRGFFSGLFGGGQQQAPAYNPPPQYAPPPQAYPSGYQPGMFQRGGSGFLGSALTTAAGVAGGVLAADALTSMFRGGGGFGGSGWGGGGFGGPGEVVNETVVNNYGNDAGAGGDPWAGAGTTDPGAGDPWGGGGNDAGNDPFAGGGGDAGDSGGDMGGGWDDDQGGGGGIF